MPATEQTWRNQHRMHLIFGISSLLLLLATIWMFVADHDRQWKGYQRTAQRIDVAYGEWDRIRAEAEVEGEKLAALEMDLLAAESTRPSRKAIDSFKAEIERDGQDREVSPGRIDALLQRIENAYQDIPELPEEFEDRDTEISERHAASRRREDLLTVLGEAVAAARFREENLLEARRIKLAEFDEARSIIDLAIRDNKPLERPRAVADRIEAELDVLNVNYDHASDHRQALQAIVDEITAAERDLRRRKGEIEGEIELIAKSVDEQRSTWFMARFPWLGKKWLEMPVLDAFNSPLQVDNLWTEGLTHDMYHFKPVLRYDRCTTCHQGMEKTQRGTATDPLYEPVHELRFALSTPTRDELARILGQDRPQNQDQDQDDAGPQAEPPTLNRVYGFLVDTRGVLRRDDVTVSFVADRSRAARATLRDDPAGVRYLSQQLIQQSLNAALPPDAPQTVFGLRAGDVILAINGSRVVSQTDVKRMLLSTVRWGEAVELTVRRGYPNPYPTHPRLDLFVGSVSPHPVQTFGCTVCHEGQGSATEFKWVSHSPSTLKQRDEWRRDHGWFDNHHWIFPMFPQRFAESSCLKCHHDVVELAPSERFPEPPAPKLMEGFTAIERFGCFGCHEIGGYDGPDRRVGPDLRLEPNYFAAGLQLAHLADRRQQELMDRIAAAEEQQRQRLQDELEAIQPALDDVRHWGRTLAQETYNERVRRRLKELVERDEQQWQRRRDAREAGDDEENDYVPLFADPSAAYAAAAVLQDEEIPGKYRKVGPSLRHVHAKLDRAFLDDWIRQPSHFRPETQMPQFFGLDKHFEDDEEEVAHTQALETIEIQGIREYLLHYSQPFEAVEGGEAGRRAALAPGDAERGKLVFETGGCLACHSNQDFPGHGDMGPVLDDLGSKFVGDQGRQWLYGWIENPQRYHPRSKMPVVPLKPLRQGGAAGAGANGVADMNGDAGAQPEQTDPIADVVEYLLADKGRWRAVDPQGETDPDRLNELALSHLTAAYSTHFAEQYAQSGIPASRREATRGAELELLVPDELADRRVPLEESQKLRYVGAKTISKYGCFGCHDIPGFEAAMPIAPALSDWGRKDTATLAFEHIDHYVGHGHGGGHGARNGHHGGHGANPGSHERGSASRDDDPIDPYFLHELEHHKREGFIYQKLREPRSFDYGKIEHRPYHDRLRMPQFPLNHEQREQIITFVLGLVSSPPSPQFVYGPSPRQQAINQGRQVLEKFNCGGCHELERERWEISFPEDWDLLRQPDKPLRFPFLFPHVTEAQRQASLEVTRSGRQSAVLSGRPKRLASGLLDLYAYDEEEEDYIRTTDETIPADALAFRFELYEPALIDGALHMPRDSAPLVPLENVQRRHPALGGELAGYLVPRVLAITGQDKGEEAWGWVPPSLVGQGSKVQPDWLHSFLLDPHPIRPAVVLNMPKFNMSPEEATKLVNYFAAKDNAEFPYSFEQRTRQAHLRRAGAQYAHQVEDLPDEQREPFTGNRFDDAMRIVLERTTGCAQCHSVADFISEGDPLAKGPNLADVYHRLRPEYLRKWLAYPWYTLPYTSMPENFKYNPDNPELDGFPVRNLYHGDSIEQLDAVVDVLMNFDKYTEGKTAIADLAPPAPELPEEQPPDDETPAAEPP